MASSGWDVLSEYVGLYPDKLTQDTQVPQMQAYPDEVLRGREPEEPMPKVAQELEKPRKNQALKKNLDKKVIDKESATSYSDVDRSRPPLTQEEEAVAAALKQGERLVDDVIAETGLTTGKLLAALTMLELKGVVQRLPGKRVRLRS